MFSIDMDRNATGKEKDLIRYFGMNTGFDVLFYSISRTGGKSIIELIYKKDDKRVNNLPAMLSNEVNKYMRSVGIDDDDDDDIDLESDIDIEDDDDDDIDLESFGDDILSDYFKGSDEDDDIEERLMKINNQDISFSVALTYVKLGYRVARYSWNEQKQYLEMVKNIEYTNKRGETVIVKHDFAEDMTIALVGASGVQFGWVANQEDMLAEDWYKI